MTPFAAHTPVRVRLYLAGLISIVSVGLTLALGFGGLAGDLFLMGIGYASAVALAGLLIPARRQADSLALLSLDLGTITFSLYLVGGLWTPAAALYVPTLVCASFVSGPRKAAAAGVVAVACYGLTAAALQLGWLPPRPGFLAVPPEQAITPVLLFATMIAIILAIAAFTELPVRARIRRPGALVLDPDASTNQLVGQVAHAIQNPLAALLGLLQMRTEAEPEGAGNRQMLLLARRVSRIVDGMLSLSRSGQLHPSPISAALLLEDVEKELEPRSRHSGVKVVTRIEHTAPEIRVDRSMLATALVSIAENAIEVAPAGSSVELVCRCVDQERAVEFRIEDRGPGMDREVARRALEPFFTTKGSGTGLGLAIADAIVHGHRGTLRIESRPGHGTTVCVELPVS